MKTKAVELNLIDVNTLLKVYREALDATSYKRSDTHPDIIMAFELLDKLEQAQQELIASRFEE